MKRAVVLVVLALATMGQTKVTDPVAQARQLYNEQKYDEAIRLAGAAQAIPTFASAASLVVARAHLERFRQSSETDDLAAARTALKRVVADALAPRDRVELLVALGESIYLDDQYALDDRYAAAAEQFEVALAHADLLDRASRDLLFDWWAGALDRQAQQDAEGSRRTVYARILDGAERELAHDDGAASASYWLASAARGVDDLPRALGAAAAGWMRAATLGVRGEALRVDLDRLVRQVILPERARELSTGTDPRPTLALLEGQWQDFTDKWKSEK
jgi:hypothetical protein